MALSLEIEKTNASGLRKYCISQPWYASLKAESMAKQRSNLTQTDVTATAAPTSNLPAPTQSVDTSIFEPVAKGARLDDSALLDEATWEISGGPGESYAGDLEYEFGDESIFDQLVDPSRLEDSFAFDQELDFNGDC